MPSAMTVLPQKCLCCEAELRTPVVCDRCHTLHPVPQSVDHFALFGLPCRFEMDPADLERRFIRLSREVHPDFFGTKAAEVQALALRLSADLNQAYRVLKDPVLRAEYLLEIAGGESAAKDKGLPDGFLPRMMMLREEVEAALTDDDAKAIADFRTQAQAERHQACADIASLAARLPAAADDDKRQLRRRLNSIKYYDNVLKLLT